ncbi:YtzI protein [Bacillus sp. CGMCC 1.16541]|uniref:YtzI protein n=1 Tax=Bacillus sp. CGMCC 1.16541 TaxID=2185143 RepID=UPI000D7336CE|nr:YtzI protein [Bacillus sp. CGMCC 1.16541]
MLYTILIISILIVAIVLILSVVTTSKAYDYKHTVDSLENNPNLEGEDSRYNKQ